jgi:hypothetical protein
MLVDADCGDAVEPAGVIDEDALALGQNGIVGGVPGTPSPSATRAMVRCWQTMPSSAHRSPRRESFARGSAALVVSCRHTCPQSMQR